jgi:hypothetical protein
VRTDVEFKTEDGTSLRGWWYRGDDMAHGFSAIRSDHWDGLRAAWNADRASRLAGGAPATIPVAFGDSPDEPCALPTQDTHDFFFGPMLVRGGRRPARLPRRPGASMRNWFIDSTATSDDCRGWTRMSDRQERVERLLYVRSQDWLAKL